MNEHHEGNVFRYVIGLLCIVGGLASLAGLYFIEIPTGNKEPLLLAIGLVLGWGGSVVQSEYGATTTGRKVAEQAVRTMERQSVIASETPTPVQVVNTPENPANVQEAHP
jgi:hypothetical protein